MKLSCFVWVALLAWSGTIVPLAGQPSEADRKQFAATKAKAEKGDTEAQIGLASLYSRGIGVARDPAKAAKWLRRAADQGAARAQCLLGLCYANGDGVKMDKHEAARWLQQAADQGLGEAQFDLGLCYAKGDGVDRDPVAAVTWYRKAAIQGLPDAQYELGNSYLEGNGVPKDIPEGVKWVRVAAERGFGAAQNTLGLCYSKGKGVTKDYVEAYKWFNLAAAHGGEQGDDARVNLAMAERFLKPEQVAEGQRLAREFRPREKTEAQESASPPVQATPKAPPATNNAALPAIGSNAGFVNVTAPDETCEIFVDGKFVGNAPARVRMPAGSHLVEVKKPGFKDYRREVTTSPGSDLTLRAVLEKQ